MPIRAKITVMLLSIRIFLLILFVLLRIQIHDKSKMLCFGSPISSVGRASNFLSEGHGFESHIGLKWNSLCLYFLWKQLFLVYDDRKCSQPLKFFQLITVLFICAVSDFLYEEFSCNAYSC